MTISANAHVKTLTNVGDPLLYQDGTPYAGVKITFQLVTFGSNKPTSVIDAVTGELISSVPTKVTTDANGEFTTTLWANNRGDQATAYYVTFSVKSFKPFFILVDDALGISLLTAKTAYSVGTGAVNASDLVVILNQMSYENTSPITVFTVSGLDFYDSISPGIKLTPASTNISITGWYYVFGKIVYYMYTVTAVVTYNSAVSGHFYNYSNNVNFTLPFKVSKDISGGGILDGSNNLALSSTLYDYFISATTNINKTFTASAGVRTAILL